MGSGGNVQRLPGDVPGPVGDQEGGGLDDVVDVRESASGDLARSVSCMSGCSASVKRVPVTMPIDSVLARMPYGPPSWAQLRVSTFRPPLLTA